MEERIEFSNELNIEYASNVKSDQDLPLKRRN